MERVMDSKERDFRFILAEDTYVVWLTGANRFLQLKEPAFFVFEAWAAGKDTDEIALECAGRYNLPPIEALRFTKEIITETEKLYLIHHEDTISQNILSGSPRVLCGSLRLNCTVLTQSTAEKAQRTEGGISDLSTSYPRTLVPSSAPTLLPPVSQFTCRILGKTIRFFYTEPELEELFRPMFTQFEKAESGGRRAEGGEQRAESGGRRAEGGGLRAEGGGRRAESEDEKTIIFFHSDGDYAFRVDDQEPQTFGANDVEHFQGAVLMELLNILHDKTRDDWMGVFHASAISDGENALLFVGDSGRGKSTLAALMVANGYRLVSDDFVPVSLGQTKVYPLPAAVSVKKGSLPVLEKLFPELTKMKTGWDEESELFLPLPEEKLERSPVRASAILLVKYDPSVEFRLVRESNLEMMNAILRQSWIPGNPEAAETFLKWYFSLPVFTLTYSAGEHLRELEKRL